MTSGKPRIILLHSETRSYRVPIFDLLSQYYDVTFFFMEGKKQSSQFSESKHWHYKDFKQYQIFGYSSDFSPGIIKELFIKRDAFDIIISSGLATFATHISFLIAKLLRKKFIIWSEDWMWSEGFFPRLALFYVRAIVRASDAYIAAGSQAKKFFIQLGANPKRIFIAPNCAVDISKTPTDIQKIENLRQTVNPMNKTIISYLGRIVAYKALDTLIDAFAELEKKHKSILLLIVGDGPFAPYCAQLIQKRNIINFFWPQYHNLTGAKKHESIPHNEMACYLHLSDIFVLSGRFRKQDHVTCESWGLTLNEAISLKKPIISTNSVAGAYDLIKNGEDGYRVAEDSPKAIFEALDFLIKNPSLCHAMGIKSREILETQFQYSNMFQGFQNAINAVFS